MQAMQQKMAPRPSVAGMNQLPMGPGMIPRAASGGLLAFAGGGDVPGYAPGGASSRYGDLTEEDIIRLENNARLYEEANPSSLSDALVPIVNSGDATLLKSNLFLPDDRYTPGNLDEFNFTPMGEAEGIRRAGALSVSDLNKEIKKQEKRLSKSSYSFESPYIDYEDQRDTIENNIKRLKDERAALVNASLPELQMQTREELIIPPDIASLENDPFANMDFRPDADPAVYGLTEEADPDAIGRETTVAPKEKAALEETTVAPEVTSKVAPEVASEVAPETETKQDDQTKREIEALFDGIVVPQDTTDTEFKKLQDALGKRDTKYEDYLQTEEYLADKAKKEDLYTAMAEFGFRMAGSDSPYALQAIGQAGAATAPSVKEALKDARARKKDAKEKLALNEVAKRQEKLNLLKAASDRSTGERKMQLDAQIAKAQKELGLYVANLNAETQKAILTADKKDEQNVQNRLANLKVLRDEPGSKYAGMSDAQLEDIARTEERTRVDSDLTREAAQLKMDLDMQKAVMERIPQLKASQDPLFLKLKTFPEQYKYAEDQLKKELERTRNARIKTNTARDPDADAARINQS